MFCNLSKKRSRLYIAIKVRNKTAAVVTSAIINAPKEYRDYLVKTITFDRGKDFSGYEEIEKELNSKTNFCDLYCAWQKGTNKITNGLLQEFYPKERNLSKVDEMKRQKNLTKFSLTIGVALNLTNYLQEKMLDWQRI